MHACFPILRLTQFHIYVFLKDINIHTVDSTYKEPCYKELLLIKNNLLGPSLCAYIFPLL